MSDEVTYPSLEAIGTQRVIDVVALDRPAVLICYAEATQHGAGAIEASVRERYAAAEVLVGHVIDLHTVPSLFRGVARNILNSEYEKAVAELPAGETAEDYVVILPDWDAAFVTALGLSDVTKQLGVAVFAADGTLLGLAQGEGPQVETLRLLET
jgi:hypothetical protein